MLRQKRSYSSAFTLWLVMLMVVVYAVMKSIVISPIYIFLIASSIATFLLYGYDKYQAGRKLSRVPERILWLTAVLGGTVGALVGMYTFKHKTRKTSFQFVVAIILLLQITLLAIFLK